MQPKVVTRFCPSPTGFFHIGSARTALFSWAYAKANGGECVFRCEDTDAKRSEDSFLLDIVKGLNWMGLDMRNLENPNDISKMQGNKNVCQSQRTDIYNKWAQKLIDNGKARRDETTKAVLFFLPGKTYFFNDLILGIQKVTEPEKEIPIIKSDGNASFHFAVVLDDHLSGITHVFRGADHLSNTPKHIALQEALEIPSPQYAHMPLITDHSGKKLSKRDPNQKTKLSEYIQEGFLPDAVINYLATMGWRHPDGKNIFNKSDLIEKISVKNMSKSPAQFDLKKMTSINGDHIKKMIESNEESFVDTVVQYLKEHRSVFYNKAKHHDISRLTTVIGDRMKKLEDFVPWSLPFVEEDSIDYNMKDFKKFIDNEESKDIIQESINSLSVIDNWTTEDIMCCFDGICTRKNLSKSKVIQPVRVAIAGSKKSPPIDETLKILGRNKSLKRMKDVICIK